MRSLIENDRVWIFHLLPPESISTCNERKNHCHIYAVKHFYGSDIDKIYKITKLSSLTKVIHWKKNGYSCRKISNLSFNSIENPKEITLLRWVLFQINLNSNSEFKSELKAFNWRRFIQLGCRHIENLYFTIIRTFLL